MSQPEMTVSSDGSKLWILNGDYHREDGPAVERSDGTKEWWLNGERHREDGPAIEWSDGSKYWCLNDKYHREDGPAIELPNGSKRWWFNGKEVSWKEVFRNANGDLEKECRILTYALTNG